MKDLIVVMPPGGMRNAFVSGILRYLGLPKPRIAKLFPCSSNGPVGECYRRGLDELAEEIWVHRLTSPAVYDPKRVLRLQRPADIDHLFDVCCKELHDFDRYPVLSDSPEAIVSLFRISDGQTVFVRVTPENQSSVYKASMALPWAARYIDINGELYADGGISIVLPVEEALEDKQSKVIFIYNRPAAKWSCGPYSLPQRLAIFPTSPRAQQALALRPVLLEQALEKIDSLPSNRALVIEPDDHFSISRFERDPRAIQEIYDHGKEVALRVRREGKLEQLLAI